MNSNLIHSSLARGAARMTLREAFQSFAGHLIKAPDFAHVSSEKTARQLTDTVFLRARDRFVFVRSEYAKKKSNVIYFGLETGRKEGREELCAFQILSGNGNTFSVWLKFKVSHHALERVQQRRTGTVFDISAFADELSPAFFSAWREGMMNATVGMSKEDKLLPTRTGALLSSYDTQTQGRIGVTWIAIEQLRPEQATERQIRLKENAEYFSLHMADGCRTGTFSGRNDRIEYKERQAS